MSKALLTTKFSNYASISIGDITAKKDEKLLWADTIRVVATVSVILLHMAGTALYQFGHTPASSWWIANIYDSAVRFCVPVFVMLSGALLLKQEVSLTYFLKRRLFRIALPFLFWTLIYYFFNLRLEREMLAHMTLIEKAKWTLVQLEVGTSSHLWYLYMIVGLYLFVPIIGKWARNATDVELQYFLLIWITTLVFNLPIISKVKFNIDIRYFTGYIGYLVLGYYLATRPIHFRLNTNTFYFALAISSVLFTSIITFFLSHRHNTFSGAVYDYLTPNVLTLSFSVFMLLKNTVINNYFLIKIIKILNRYSFGIYFAHIIFLTLFAEMGFTWSLINPLVGIPLMTLACLVASLITTYLLSKLPYGKYLI